MGYFFSSIGTYLKRQWPFVVLIMVAIAVQMVFRLAMPIAYQQILDQAIAQSNLRRLLIIIGLLGGLWVVQTMFSLVQDVASARVGLRVVNQVRARMYDLISLLPSSRMQLLSSGDLLSRFSNDLVTIEYAVVQALFVFVFSTLNLVLSLLLLFHLDWRLAALTTTGLLLTLVLPRLFSARATRANYQRKGEEGHLISTIQEQLLAQDVVRAFNLRQMLRQRFDQQVQAFDRRAMQAYWADTVVGRVGSQSAYLLQIAILLTGSYFSIMGSMTIGTLIGFAALLQNLVAAISHLSGAMPHLLKASASLQRVDEILDLEPEAAGSPSADTMPRPQVGLTCHELGFSYQGQVEALRSVAFSCQLGTRTAVVGPSGCGKTTLMRLILGFDKPAQGRITVDGRDLLTFSREAWRVHLGLVPQEPFLFHMSMRENIRVGRLSATDEEIEQAARAAGIHEFIMGLPRGYESLVRERGSNLSGGQRQRIAIARAILRDPAFLVLDEATSALDPATEQDLFATLEQIRARCALLSVTHRLHTITGYEQILVMNQGELVERGSHHDLLADNGIYRELWEKQQGFEICADGLQAAIKPERLRKIPLFAEVDPHQLVLIAQQMESEFLPKGRLLFEKGDPGKRFYIIVDGLVEVTPHAEDSLRFHKVFLENGDFFGELALLDNKPRSATVKVLLPTLFLSLSRQRFDQLLMSEPHIKATLEREAASRRVRLS